MLLNQDIPQVLEANLEIECTSFEDNKGAEELAEVQKDKPITKHTTSKCHCFRSSIYY